MDWKWSEHSGIVQRRLAFDCAARLLAVVSASRGALVLVLDEGGVMHGVSRLVQSIAGTSLIAIGLALYVQPAHACSLALCIERELMLPQDGATLPANVVDILWDDWIDYASEANLVVTSVESDGARSPLEFELSELKPGWTRVHLQTEALTPSTRLELEYGRPGCAGSERITTSFEVVEPARPPQRLGTLSVKEKHGRIRVRSTGGDCSREIYASYADFELTPDEAVLPYLHMLRFELLAGTEHWTFYSDLGAAQLPSRLGASSLGEGKDRIFIHCPQPGEPDRPPPGGPYLGPGIYRVAMIGKLPDGRMISSEDATATLRCPDPADVAAASDGGANHDGDEVGRRESSQLASDAGSADTAGGDGCSITDGNDIGGAAWLLVIAGARAARARRSRTRDCPEL